MNKVVNILLLLLSSFYLTNSFAQSANPKGNTINIKTQPTQPKEIGMRIFELYKAEAFDTLLLHFLPTQDVFLTLLRQAKMDTSDNSYKSAKNDFSQVEKDYLEWINKHAKAAKEHGVDFKSMTADSVTYKIKTNEKVADGVVFSKLLYITVFCKDKNEAFEFHIYPLFNFKGKWYLFETDLGFSIRS